MLFVKKFDFLAMVAMETEKGKLSVSIAMVANRKKWVNWICTMQEKMSQPIKSLFWDKWVWYFETIALAFYAKNRYISLSLHVKSLELRENYHHSIISKSIWIRLQKCFNLFKKLKQYTKLVPETVHHLQKHFFDNRKITLNYWFICKFIVRGYFTWKCPWYVLLAWYFFLFTQWWQHLITLSVFCGDFRSSFLRSNHLIVLIPWVSESY